MNSNSKISEQVSNLLSSKRLKKEDIESLQKLVDNFSSDDDIEAWLQSSWDNSSYTDEAPELFELIAQKIDLKKEQKNKFVIGVFAEKIIAASVIGLLCVGAWFYANTTKQESHILVVASSQLNTSNEDVQLIIGKDKYNLTEQNISITDKGVQLVGTQTELRLTRNKVVASNVRVQKWSTLKVPVAKDFFVELVDGTKVWLNACSEITFPDYFVDGKREVYVKGEAFFHVQSDIINPFLVHTPNSVVEVTGTKFNVNSYSNEPNTVTLQEGRVQVIVGDHQYELVPGEQLVSSKSGRCDIIQVDAKMYSLWRDGVFEFNNMPIKDMAVRLERWYNVKFSFENATLADERFSGMVKKEYDIEYFIRVLEKTTNYKFALQGSEIVVKEK